MLTERNATLFEFEAVERRAVVAGFDGGDINLECGGAAAWDRWIAVWA